jgi:hypothetical protein
LCLKLTEDRNYSNEKQVQIRVLNYAQLFEDWRWAAAGADLLLLVKPSLKIALLF